MAGEFGGGDAGVGLVAIENLEEFGGGVGDEEGRKRRRRTCGHLEVHQDERELMEGTKQDQLKVEGERRIRERESRTRLTFDFSAFSTASRPSNAVWMLL